jgi:hypothetical protein
MQHECVSVSGPRLRLRLRPRHGLARMLMSSHHRFWLAGLMDVLTFFAAVVAGAVVAGAAAAGAAAAATVASLPALVQV